MKLILEGGMQAPSYWVILNFSFAWKQKQWQRSNLEFIALNFLLAHILFSLSYEIGLPNFILSYVHFHEVVMKS